MPVVFYHIGLAWFPGGFIGVDVFFVISGFLITGLLLQTIEEERFSLLDFYQRRIRRIFPALFAAYFFSFVAGIFIFLPNDMMEVGRSIGASAVFISNILFYQETGYFDGPTHLKPLLHTWSLSVEEQFYIFWPLLLLALSWLGNRRAFIGTLLIAIVSFGLAQWILSSDSKAAFYLLPFRAWELLIGALVAMIAAHIRLSKGLAEVTSFIGIVLIVGSVVLLTDQMPFPGLNAAYACVGTAFVILATTHHTTITGQALSLRPMVLIGLISYSLYLIHWPIIVFWRYAKGGDISANSGIAIVMISIVAAALMWRFIEQPFRGKTVKLPAGKTVLSGAVSCVLIAVAGYFFHKEDGFTFNLDPQIRAINLQARSKNPYRRKCNSPKNALINDEVCNFGAPLKAGGFDVAIFGDSNADHFVPAISILTKKAGLSGRQLTRAWCPSLFGLSRESSNANRTIDCAKTQRAMNTFIERNPNLKLIVLAHSWAAYFEGSNYGGKGEQFFSFTKNHQERSKENTRLAMRDALLQTINALKKRGLKIWILSQIPPFLEDPYGCVGRAIMLDNDPKSCSVSATSQKDFLLFTNSVFDEIRTTHPKIPIYDPFQNMCTGGICFSYLDNTLLYRDPVHLNLYGSQWISQFMKLPIPPK